MGYIKSKTKYVLKTKHQDVNEGQVYERDMSTVGGIVELPDGNNNVVYRSGNFVLTNNTSRDVAGNYKVPGWVSNDYSGNIWNGEILENFSEEIPEDIAEHYFHRDVYDLRTYAYYGSCVELVNGTINEILSTFPGEFYVMDHSESNPIHYSYISSQNGLVVAGTLDEVAEREGYGYQVSNPFWIDMHSMSSEDNPNIRIFANSGWSMYNFIGEGSEMPCDVVGWSSETRFWYKTPGNAVPYNALQDGPWEDIVASGLVKECFLPGDVCAYIQIEVNCGDTQRVSIYRFIGIMGNDNMVYYFSKTRDNIQHGHIRPKSKYYREFYRKLSSFGRVLMGDMDATVHKAVIDVLHEYEGDVEQHMESFLFPLDNGRYNLQTEGTDFEVFTKSLFDVAKYYDENFSDNIYRNITHDVLKDYDWSRSQFPDDVTNEDLTVYHRKIKAILRIFGRFFDELKGRIESLSNGFAVTYGNTGGVSPYYVSQLLETKGWETVQVYSKTLTEYVVDQNGNKRFRVVDSSSFGNEFSDYLKLTGATFETNTQYDFEECQNKMLSGNTWLFLNHEFSDDSDYTYIPYTKGNSNHNAYFKTCDSVDFESAENNSWSSVTNEYVIMYGRKLYLNSNRQLVVNIDGVDYSGTAGRTSITIAGTNYPLFNEVNVLKRIRRFTSEKEYTADDVNNEFQRRMLLCFPHIMKKKGTIDGIDSVLSLFNFKGKNFVENLPEYVSGDRKYDYSIDEYTCLTNPLRDMYIDKTKKKPLIAYYNYLKVNKFDPYDDYDGLMVKKVPRYSGAGDPNTYEERYVSGCVERTFCGNMLYPYFDPSKTYDGHTYYQMYGGWKKEYPYGIARDGRLLCPPVENGCVMNKWSPTWRHIDTVRRITDLVSLGKSTLVDGTICYVTEPDKPYFIVNGKPFEIKSERIRTGNTYTYCSYISLYTNGYSVSINDKLFNDEIVVSSPNSICSVECGSEVSTDYTKAFRRRYTFTKPSYDEQREIRAYLYHVVNIAEQSESGSTGGGPEASKSGGAIMPTRTKKPFYFREGMDLSTYDIHVDIFNTEEQCNDGYIFGYDKDRMSNYFRLQYYEMSTNIGNGGWSPLYKNSFYAAMADEIRTVEKGNNPHSDRLGYDLGSEYIYRIAFPFKYVIEHGEINGNTRTTIQDAVDFMADIEFPNLVSGKCNDYIKYADTKIHGFADMYMQNGWHGGDGNIMAFSDTNLEEDALRTNISINGAVENISQPVQTEDSERIVMDSAHTAYFCSDYRLKNIGRIYEDFSSEPNSPYYIGKTNNEEPGIVTGSYTADTGTISSASTEEFDKAGDSTPDTGDVTGETIEVCSTDRIINTKVVNLTFYLHEDRYGNAQFSKGILEEMRFIEECVMPYVEQVIPASSILQISYEFPETENVWSHENEDDKK